MDGLWSPAETGACCGTVCGISAQFSLSVTHYDRAAAKPTQCAHPPFNVKENSLKAGNFRSLMYIWLERKRKEKEGGREKEA